MINETELIEKFEQIVGCFLLSNIDKKHFRDEEDSDLDPESHIDEVDWNYYNKERINKKLKKFLNKKPERYIRICGAGKELYNVMIGLGIKINKNAFFLLAYLRDLNDGVKVLETEKKND